MESKTEYMTKDEHDAVGLLASFATIMATKIIKNGPTSASDMAEVVHHVHILQQLVMSQAAARANPTKYRLLGDSVERVNSGV